jgi:hypothetical protein
MVNHGHVRGEIAGHRSFACPCEIGGFTNNYIRRARYEPSCQLQSASRHAQSDIDAFLHQVDVALVEQHFNFQVWMRLEKFR